MNLQAKRPAERWVISIASHREGDFDPRETDPPERVLARTNGHVVAKNLLNGEHR